MGAGESGVGTAILAKKQGWNVFVSDYGIIDEKFKKTLEELTVDWEESTHTTERILQSNLVVKSPGIPDTAPIIQAIKKAGIDIVSEIEFAGNYNTAKTICITGSNGKTTTAMLTHHILKNAGINVGLAGNIGDSFAKQVAREDFDWYVLELSSFQLDDMHTFKADIAILLNITPDHLDRYNYEMQNYVDSKMRIVQNQTKQDWFIYNYDDPIIQKEVEKRTKGLMCLCEKVALASVTNAGVGLTSTNEGDDNAPYPGYLRANYANNLQVTPSSTICHGMVVSKLIDAKKCLVSCSIMEQYIRAASGQDAMVCQKAVEESGIVIDGNILGEDDEDDKKVGLSGGGASSLLRL